MPDNLKIQESIIFELLESLWITAITAPGYEADDIIGTLVTKFAKDPENDIYILSGDKDLYQFTGKNVAVYDMMKRTISREKETIEKFWVSGIHVVDYLAICGDSSDNIPGIPGFGPKKAQELIGKYGSLEEIYEHLDEITGKTKEVLEASREVAFLSKTLATIPTDVDIPFPTIQTHPYKSREVYTPEFVEFLKKYEFKSLLPKSSQTEKKNIKSLAISVEEILSLENLAKISGEILGAKEVGIATSGQDFSVLSGISLSVGKKVYWFDPVLVDLRSFLQDILSKNIELIGFDIKPDVKRIWYYIENYKPSSSKEEAVGQISLF
jgi:DNA polymerase-1